MEGRAGRSMAQSFQIFVDLCLESYYQAHFNSFSPQDHFLLLVKVMVPSGPTCIGASPRASLSMCMVPYLFAVSRKENPKLIKSKFVFTFV